MEEESFPDLRFGPVYNEPECGMAKMSKRRVVGGSSAGFGTFPWQALIRIKSSRCGGALVGPRHVVTAGHCVNPLGKDILESDTPPKARLTCVPLGLALTKSLHKCLCRKYL